MKLSSLQNNQIVKYRIGRAGPTEVIWGKWTIASLYVARRQQDLPAKLRNKCKYWKAGDITTLTTVEDVCAEFNQNDFCDDGIFNAEDWYLEIDGLEKD